MRDRASRPQTPDTGTGASSGSGGLEAICEAAGIGTAVSDRSGRFLEANRPLQEMTGYSGPELLSMSFQDVTLPEDYDAQRPLFQGLLAGERDHYQIEKRYVRKDGKVIWVRVTESLLPGETDKTIAMIEDITERKAVEAEREAILRQKDDFLSAVAHDLRTPLTAVKGRAQMLARLLERDEVDVSRLLEGLKRIDAGASTMITLISELLDVANIQLGRPLMLQREPTDLVALARTLAVEHGQTAERHEIVFASGYSEVVGMWDPIRLERVLSNLMSNAVKYSPAGGRITVTVDRIEDGAETRAVLSVSDRGIGIPADDLPSIFERFHRGINVEGSISGTGIGLTAVRRIVEQHGGVIEVRSEEGAGSTFTVLLPLE